MEPADFRPGIYHDAEIFHGPPGWSRMARC
jgi:hypothetical protein